MRNIVRGSACKGSLWVVRRIGRAACFDWGAQPFFYTRSFCFARPMLDRPSWMSARPRKQAVRVWLGKYGLGVSSAPENGLNRKERQIESLIEPIVRAAGLQVWGVQYLAQGKHSMLRIYIDRALESASASASADAPVGISVSDCEMVSHQISELLDVEELITGEYTLEVSSPGMDRQLFHAHQYENAVGEVLDVRLSYPFEGRKKLIGLLTGVEDNEAVIRIESQEYVLPIETIAKATVVPQFEEAELPGKTARKSGKKT